MGKGQNAGTWTSIFSFSHDVYSLSETEITIGTTLNLSSANAFNLVKAKILLFGKELILDKRTFS